MIRFRPTWSFTGATALSCLVHIAILVVGCSATSAATRLDFQTDVLPILSDRCFTCHGPDEAVREADLRLDRREDLFAEHGSANEGRAIVKPGSTDNSELVRRILSDDEDTVMPPPHAERQLSAAEQRVLVRWVQEGAEWTQHWAFTPPTRPAVPRVPPRFAAFVQNPIDHFILAKLAEAQLEPSLRASRETLIRRVSFDLTGLPPTLEEVDRFVEDRAPNAYGRLVDRLLDSPRYGEHMAQFWLDVAHYADTDGYQNDRYRYHHVWRDWVIDAINRSLPFDQFVVEQLAGDMLPEATLRQQIATGFGRNHRINSEAGSIPEEWQVEYVVDRVDTLGTALMGLTIGCARCHDHKYDPISQREFYQLFAFFNNVPEFGTGPNNGNSPPFIEIPDTWPRLAAEQDRLLAPIPLTWQDNDQYKGGVRRPEPGSPTTLMVMAERAEPRKTYRLNRGRYDQPDTSEALSPAVPAVLGQLPNSAPTNRLGLAQWLVSDENPLTARVIVNRWWQRFFDVGLVATSENFGVQGSRPSHPQLLDWLASEVKQSNWNMKRLHRLIVTSATYQQSSVGTTVSADFDPNNRYLSHFPRARLTAQQIRDQALSAAGLLVERQGGPSAKPYMPPKIWRAISNNKYEQDHGANLYRRSLYTYWRRTIPPPTMMTFNAFEREVCEVRKQRTNTPLQALTLMNNVTFHEAARFIAERMIHAAPHSVEQQISHGFRLMTGRIPSQAELEHLRDAYIDLEQMFTQDTMAAKRLLAVGEAPRDKGLSLPQHAALTLVASSLLNLDESITKE